MLSRALGVVGRLLIGLGLLVLGFVAFQLWGTGLEQSRRQDELTQDLADSLAAVAPEPDAADPGDDPATLAASLARVDPATAPPMAAPPAGEPVGVIEIPRIELARVIVEGTTRAELKKGPGHYTGTPLPGQAGNVGIAGHRTTYGAPFNRIDEILPGDEIIVSTAQGRFVYRAVAAPDSSSRAWYTVSPDQVDVLADMGDDRITLTACHPKYSARQRIVVNGVLESPPAAATPVTDRPADPEGAEPTGASAANAADFDEGLGATPDELPRALAWLAGAAAVLLAAVLLARSARHRWLVWVVATPVVVALVWNGYIHMDRYLPAI